MQQIHQNDHPKRLEDSARYAVFRRDLHLWYIRQRKNGSFDVRLEDYSFRSVQFHRFLAARAAENEKKAATMEKVGDSAQAKRAKVDDTKLLHPPSLALRVNFEKLPKVAVWNRSDDVDELTDIPRDMGAGLSVVKNESGIDIVGSPTECSTIKLDLGEMEIELSVTPDYVVVARKYLLSEAGLVELPDYSHHECDWQLQPFFDNEISRFVLLYKTQQFVVALSREGVVVNMRRPIIGRN